MKNYKVLLIIIIEASIYLFTDNYYDQDFDEDKNCQGEEKIREMMKNEKESCAEENMGKLMLKWFQL